MPSVLVQLDEETYRSLNKVAPPNKRKRTEFIRRAIQEAIHAREFARMREAYRRQPDSATDIDDWSNCEEFNP